MIWDFDSVEYGSVIRFSWNPSCLFYVDRRVYYSREKCSLHLQHGRDRARVPRVDGAVRGGRAGLVRAPRVHRGLEFGLVRRLETREPPPPLGGKKDGRVLSRRRDICKIYMYGWSASITPRGRAGCRPSCPAVGWMARGRHPEGFSPRVAPEGYSSPPRARCAASCPASRW